MGLIIEKRQVCKEQDAVMTGGSEQQVLSYHHAEDRQQHCAHLHFLSWCTAIPTLQNMLSKSHTLHEAKFLAFEGPEIDSQQQFLCVFVQTNWDSFGSWHHQYVKEDPHRDVLH